jgi:hypothetical protein
MSNIWYYELLVSHPQKISISDVEIVASILNRYGFSLYEPHSGTIHGFRIDEELDDYSEEFTDMGGVADWWNHDGALIHAWMGMAGISISFTTHQFFRVKDFSGSTVHGVCLMHLSVDAASFHDGDPNRDQLADDILNIFTDLCDSFHAIYGYSQDENYIEMIIKKPYCVTSYDFTKDPEYIFWLNYFPRDYIDQYQPSLLEVPGAVTKNSLLGVVVSYASKPWGISIHSLKLNNEYARNWFLGKDRSKKIFKIWIKLAAQVAAAVELISLVLFFYSAMFHTTCQVQGNVEYRPLTHLYQRNMC